MTKNEIRAAAKARRRSLTHNEIVTKSEAALTLLLPYLENADTVFCYMAAFNEPRTGELIERLISYGKRVAVPVTDTVSNTITPVLYTGRQELISGAMGIPEPKSRITVASDEIDAAVIPGIAFDRDGTRIGFGAGYYDRFLEGFKGLKIGLCYDFQVYDRLPRDTHDIPMDVIVTERTAYDI
ncbi:MAG: 5-formyltetrahydrofolate cyclo-ligase [Clostridia bacterium]|nr:5-formyltetrahydrofolate cyclo-ligase [Clostridia bacterium]